MRSYRRTEEADYDVVEVLAARLDPAGWYELREALGPPGRAARNLILDLRNVVYVVSPALNVILEAHHHARQQGVHFVLVHLQPQVRRVINLAGFESHLIIRETYDEARQVFA